MRLGLPCLRPSEEAMVQAAQLWARIAAAAEVSVADQRAVSRWQNALS